VGEKLEHRRNHYGGGEDRNHCIGLLSGVAPMFPPVTRGGRGVDYDNRFMSSHEQ